MHGSNDNPSPWKDLYRIAGISSVTTVVAILLGIGLYPFYPYAPGRLAAEQILVSLQQNPLGGMISLDLFLLMSNILGLVVYLALYVSLKPTSPSYALIALILGLMAVVLIVVSRPILELVNLSRNFASVGLDEKAQLLAAAETLLSLFDGTGWFASTMFGAISLLISSLLMLRTTVYSKATTWVGIVTNLLVCGFFLPVIGKFLLFLTVPGYFVFYSLLARRYFQLSKTDTPSAA